MTLLLDAMAKHVGSEKAAPALLACGAFTFSLPLIVVYIVVKMLCCKSTEDSAQQIAKRRSKKPKKAD